MLSNGKIYCTYDSANRLTYAGGISYTYNAEDVRIRAFSEEEDTTYTYDTNCKLSKLLTKTTNGVVTKYVYGKGLIGEESDNTFKTYHFDCRGSTVAITDANGNVTDTFAYDTYGKLLSRTGDTPIIFGYNGRDGVVTDSNGLVYMRARYYSPDMRRFVNADIVAGEISNAVTLNRFAYANGNPVSFVDPFGLSAERGMSNINSNTNALGSSENVSVREFVESRGGTVTWNESLGLATFELNGITLSVNRYGHNLDGIEIHNDNGSMMAVKYDLAYYFKVENWATYLPEFDWYDGSEGDEGDKGFGVKTIDYFLSREFCLDFAKNIIEIAGTDGKYLGQDQMGIAQECYAHAVIYVWSDLSIKLINKGYSKYQSAEKIGYVEYDENRFGFAMIWNAGIFLNEFANTSAFNIRGN